MERLVFKRHWKHLRYHWTIFCRSIIFDPFASRTVNEHQDVVKKKKKINSPGYVNEHTESWLLSLYSTQTCLMTPCTLKYLTKKLWQCTLQAGPFSISNQSISWHLSVKSDYYRCPSLQAYNRRTTVWFIEEVQASSEEGEPILLDTYPTKFWQDICIVPLGPYPEWV